MKHKGFTLIEMLIAVTIFSIAVVFLYKVYGEFSRYNKRLQTKSTVFASQVALKETLYLDFALALEDKVAILHQDKENDVVFFPSSHSLFGRINPYISYVLKEGVLYRIESLANPKNYPFDAEFHGDITRYDDVKKFRVYQAFKKDGKNIQTLFLIDIRFTNGQKLVYKIPRFAQK